MQYVVLIDKRHDSDYPAWFTAGTGDGRKRAKERGVRFGRPRKLAAAMRYESRTWLSGSRQPSCSVFMSSRPDQFAAASEYRA